MLVVWRKAASFNGRSKVSTWIFSIAYRKALKAIKRFDEPVEAVIFDMDGLLLDSETLVRTASIEAAAAIGYEMTNDMFHDLIGHPGDVINAQLLSFFGPHFPLDEFVWKGTEEQVGS